MPRLVVDASVAVKWLNPSEPLADRAIAIRDDYEQGNVSLFVPAFWDYEVANAMNKAVARGDLTDEEGQRAVETLLSVRAQRVSLPSPQKSDETARRYQRSVYDSWYLLLAEETGCEFWTADLKLYNAVHRHTVFAKWLGDYEATEP